MENSLIVSRKNTFLESVYTTYFISVLYNDAHVFRPCLLVMLILLTFVTNWPRFGLLLAGSVRKVLCVCVLVLFYCKLCFVCFCIQCKSGFRVSY